MFRHHTRNKVDYNMSSHKQCDMIARATMISLVAFLSILATAADQKGMSKFIASVHQDYESSTVAKRINELGSSSVEGWSGRVEKMHHNIRVLIVKGQGNTCEVIGKLDGVQTCEADSIISIHE